MKTFFAISFSFIVLTGSALADVNSARRDANRRIDQSKHALEAVRVCVREATSEAAITECRVDLFPVESNAQKMEDKKMYKSKTKSGSMRK